MLKVNQTIELIIMLILNIIFIKFQEVITNINMHITFLIKEILS
jgi:hypothetical protein